MKQPPISALEKSSDQHRVVTFTNVAFVVRCLGLLLVVDCQLLLTLSHIIECVLVDRLLEDRASNILLGLELILCVKHLAHMYDYLLLYRICILSNLERRWHELISCELDA